MAGTKATKFKFSARKLNPNMNFIHIFLTPFFIRAQTGENPDDRKILDLAYPHVKPMVLGIF